MSFLRPAVASLIRRWAEPAAAALIAALALRWGIALAAAGVLFGWFVLGVAALALFWLRAAVIGALAAGPATGAGVVQIREGEIGYLGPWRGGFLELDALSRVEIYVVADGQDPVWRLVAADGTALGIPSTAEGAAHLPEALSALPGFSDMTAVAVLQRRRAGRHVVWQRAERVPARFN